MEHLSSSLVILLAEALDGIGTLQIVNGEDIVSPDGRVQVGKIAVDMLCHLAVQVVEWQHVVS